MYGDCSTSPYRNLPFMMCSFISQLLKNSSTRPVSEIIAESEEAKRKRAKRIEDLTDSGWKEMNLAANDYVFERTLIENSYLVFKDRDATVLGLFRTFYDEGLIGKIRGEKTWNYKAGREINVEKLSNKVIYQFLAIVVGSEKENHFD